MTENAPTIPPVGPLPSTLPDSDRPHHVEVYHLGRALNALELVNEYVKGRVDSELLDAIQNHAFKEHERSEERWERLERGQVRILANQELLLDHFRSLTGRLTKLEGQHAGNHPVTLSVPPSQRGQDIEPEAEAL